jgi:protein-L-isoaspartate(D-aspartate) O-methyltransferase
VRQTERHRFIPGRSCSVAYMDGPVPIGRGQTISQPFVVALMTDLAAVKSDHTVLEVGTGSGYQGGIKSPLSAGWGNQLSSISICAIPGNDHEN